MSCRTQRSLFTHARTGYDYSGYYQYCCASTYCVLGAFYTYSSKLKPFASDERCRMIPYTYKKNRCLRQRPSAVLWPRRLLLPSALNSQRGNCSFGIDPWPLLSPLFFLFSCVALFLRLLPSRKARRRHNPSSDSHRVYVPQAQRSSLLSFLHRAPEYTVQQ